MNADTARMFRVRKTCLKMLQKRGYVIPETHLRMTPQEFTDVFGDSPSRESLTVSAEKDDESIFVFFPDDEKVGVKVNLINVFGLYPDELTVQLRKIKCLAAA